MLIINLIVELQVLIWQENGMRCVLTDLWLCAVYACCDHDDFFVSMKKSCGPCFSQMIWFSLMEILQWLNAKLAKWGNCFHDKDYICNGTLF